MLKNIGVLRILTALPALLVVVALAAACASSAEPQIVEVIKEVEVIVEKPVVVEKEVVREVIVEKPVEVVKEITIEKPIIVEKEVIKEVTIEKPVIVEKEVVREVTVEKPVIQEVEVIKEVERVKTVVVEKETVTEVTVDPYARFTPQIGIHEYIWDGAAPTKYSEGPNTALQVERGTLPAIGLRLPNDPLIIIGPDGIGEYGGTVKFAFFGTGDDNIAAEFANENLLRGSVSELGVRPHVASTWDMSSDGSQFTFGLRKGMKWSDGEAFTADDYAFVWDEVNTNAEYTGLGGNAWTTGNYVVGGELGEFSKIDDSTIRWDFAAPYSAFLLRAASGATHGPSACDCDSIVRMPGAFTPKHYMKQFHPAYNSDVQATAEAEGFESWTDLFWNKATGTRNPDIPVVGAMNPVNGAAGARIWRLERNPYYFAIDPEGNQLPYLDSLEGMLVGDLEILSLHAYSGQLDYQFRHSSILNLPLMAQNTEKGNFRIMLRRHPNSAVVYVNQTCTGCDTAIYDLLRNLEFRKALSYGIDREELQAVAWYGTGTPRASLPLPEHPMYPGAEYEKLYIDFDPDLANGILDDLGLDEKNDEGMRLLPSGDTVKLWMNSPGKFIMNYDAMGELMVEQFRNNLGLDAFYKQDNNAELMSSRQLFIYQTLRADFWLNSHALPCCPYRNSHATEIQPWVASGGAEGVDPNADPVLAPIAKQVDLFNQGLTATTEDRNNIGAEIWKINAEQLYTIGLIGADPGAYGTGIVRKSLRNVLELTPRGQRAEVFFHAR